MLLVKGSNKKPMNNYKTIKENINYSKEMLKHLGIVNLEFFKQTEDEVEILKGVDYQTFRSHPRTMYEMANIRMGEVAFFDGSEYEFEEIYTFMTPSEQKAYDSLPPLFKVYRGYTSHKIDIERAFNSQSWTVDKKVAEFFIKEHKLKYKNIQHESVLFEKLIFKSNVDLILLARGEAEIIISQG